MLAAGTPITEIMSKDVVVLRPDATLDEALATLRDYALGTAPVVDERGECVGMFALADRARHDADTASSDEPDTVADWMTPAPKWVPLDTTALEAARIMAEEGIHHLVVMERGAVRGIISALDFVRAFARSGTPKKPARSKKPATGVRAKSSRR